MLLFDRPLENRPVDPSEEFNKQHNHFFLAQKLAGFDPRSASGKVRWEGSSLEQRVSYHQVTLPFAHQKAWVDVPPERIRRRPGFPLLDLLRHAQDGAPEAGRTSA